MMAAAKVPEFAMTEPEAQQLSVAICNYLRHTDIRMTQKTQDFVALIMALAMVEGTRIIAATNGVKVRRQMMERQQARSGVTVPDGGNVRPFMSGTIPGVI